MYTETIIDDINSLPLEYRKEAIDFIEYLKIKVTKDSDFENINIKFKKRKKYAGKFKDIFPDDSSEWVRKTRMTEFRENSE